MRVPPRRIRRKFEAGGHAFGATIQIPSPEIVEIAGYTGLDYVWIDAEHGTMDLSVINHMVRAADASGIDAIVRVPDHSPSFIQRVLDIGAAGIIAPHVRSVDVAQAVVAAAKYAPLGVRGACPSSRSCGHWIDDWDSEARRANDDVLVFGLIEDVEGIEDVEAIAREGGMDGLLFGPVDLAQALGLAGGAANPEIGKLRERLIAAATSAGIEYLSITDWEFREITEIASYSRVLNVSSDKVLVPAFGGALAKAVQALAPATVGSR